MRVAIAQMPMGWTVEENTRSILVHLEQASALGADVAVFPECATTGFHRRVPQEVSRRGIHRAVRRIRAGCRALGLPAVVGTPWFAPGEEPAPWNAAVAIGARGQVLAVAPKVGLTHSEGAFFRAGADRPAFALGGVSCGTVLCREVRDAADIRTSLADVRVVFWPGAIAWGNDASHPENVVTRGIAAACARTLGVHLVQCNWPNALNAPDVSGMGGSLVISPAGEIVHECPADQPGVSIVTLDLDHENAASR